MQDFKDGKWYDNNKEMIYKQLTLIGDNPDPELIDAAIGNSSWTHLGCSECNTEVNEVILFGVVDYDSEYCYLCKNCLAKALDLF